jgi:hypothetical protein
MRKAINLYLNDTDSEDAVNKICEIRELVI